MFAAYMPQREASDVTEAWAELTQAATGVLKPWIVGDMNAEARAVIVARSNAAQMATSSTRDRSRGWRRILYASSLAASPQ